MLLWRSRLAGKFSDGARHGGRECEEKKIDYTENGTLFLLCPFLSSFFLFLLYPIINMVYTSFHKLEGISKYRYVGMANYERLMTDTHIKAAICNSLGFTVGIIVVNVTLALFLAVLLNHKVTPCRNAFRTAIYIPDSGMEQIRKRVEDWKQNPEQYLCHGMRI